MEYNTFASKDAFQISSGDNTKKGAQTKSINLLPLRPTAGLDTLDQSASSVVDAVISQDSETASFLNLDTSYKQKLRSGVIEFLNTVHDSKYRGSSTFAKRSIGYSGQGLLARSCEIPVASSTDVPLNYSDQPIQTRSHKRLNERKKLYRSNSSLELDHFTEDARSESVLLNRDYGSANSLDAAWHFRNGYSPSFQSYRQGLENLNRSAKECGSVLRGGMIGQFTPTNKGIKHLSASGNPSNLLNMDGGSTAAAGDPPQSPRPETKFQKSKESKARNDGGGIFRKLRGVKSDPSGATGLKSLQDSNARADVGSKAFCHYDCQSISVRMSDVIKRRTEMNSDVNFKRLNVTTGASAASVATRIVPSNSTVELDTFASNDESDDGDGKSNDMLLSCSFFHNELGGEEVRSVTINQETAQRRLLAKSGGGIMAASADHMTDPLCNAIQVMDCSLTPKGFLMRPFQSAGGYVFEYFDNGAHYYRHFFSDYEHQNFFGIDDNIGPVAISIRREKVFEKDAKGSDEKTDSGPGWFYQYRIIVRTSELTSLRGSILEDNIPSSSRLSSAKGLLAKDILEFIMPVLNMSCLHQAMPGPKTSELLMKVDEQGISKAYKIGIMLCRAGQATEEEMYNNETSSPSFDEFLSLIGSRIKLKCFENYRGGLDVKSDSTGKESLYTKLDDYEIMFHVSTLLPFTPNNKQQLLRKRHIGNDIVTIIFQEPGALPFTPKSVRSQFQHVFIVVKVHNPSSENTQYSVAVSRSKNVPYFGPLIPDHAHFSRSEHFKEFLLVKAINAENAVHKSDKFMAMAVRTRQEYLKDLALNHVVSSSIDSGSRLSKLTLGSGRKKDKTRLVRIPDIRSKAAVVWNVHVEDFVNVVWVSCQLGIASEVIVIVEELTSSALFTTSCQSVIGWTLKPESNTLRLFINQGECILISANGNELKEIVSRLEMVTTGSHTEEKSLYRNSDGHLGFHVYDGIVSEIDSTGPAFLTKLKPGSNIVEVCSVIAATLSQNHLIEFLRTSKNVTISVIPPHDTGVPRSYKGGAFEGLTVEPLQHQTPGAQLWRQHHSVPTTSNHSSLERKGPEQSKASMNDLHSVNETGLKTEAAECSSSGELHVTFHTAYPIQNAYKGSHLSLLHKADPIGSSIVQKTVRSVGASASVPYGQTTVVDGSVNSRNNVTSSGSAAASAFVGEESKQAAMSRKLMAAVEQLYQSSNLRSHESTSNWFSSGDSAPAKSYVLQNFHLNSELDRMQQQQHLSHSQSFNKGSLFSTLSDQSRLMPQQQQQKQYQGPELLADSSDSVNSDSKTKYRKSVNARITSSRLTPSKSFQKDLIRLIDTEVPPSEILVSSNYDSDDRPETLHTSQHCHSDDNICASTQRSYLSLDDSHSELYHQKMRSNVVEIPGTIYRLQTSHSSTAIPLPVASSTRDDWSSLVDAAERTFEVEPKSRGLPVEAPQSSRSPFTPSSGKASSVHKAQNSVEAVSNHTPLLLTHRGPCQDVASDVGQLADETQTDATRIKDLEAKVASLDRKLQMERKERMVLELEMDKLRQDNVRLQEESQTAASQLRRFTEWFFQTIDKR